ncbi:hypothetical protein GE107_08290 [Cohnella sp. CFH 77786]|uniref:hypothetical protein n=1 Tax=Cohnella sp. CFH 77786 TaxID=2662265 RepID=UPI001C60C1D9|nr:hypothetical protein [Cohnella sp. CFH 77786]MBW5446059.1 hypothetical protein [Cohnella sp. CFH 77786]
MSAAKTMQSESTRFFQGEQGLVWTGLLGFLLAGACALWVIMKGGSVPPEGDVSKAFSFNAALGMFVVSTAAILPFSGMGSRVRAVFRWTYIALCLYAYGVETVQHFRGINPRFTQSGTAADALLGAVFGLVAVLLVVFYLILAVQYFFARSRGDRPILNLGIRYAMIATVISFAAGIWISVQQDRYTGTGGNIIWLHGFGFHALQVLPLAAWLAERTALPGREKRRAVHAAGILYLAGLSSIGVQTMLGRSIWELSALPLSALACFLIGTGIGIALLRSSPPGLRQGHNIPPKHNSGPTSSK